MPSYQQSIRAWLRRGLREEQGSFAVEFAFIAPVLILLLGAIVEGSMLFYTWGNMEHLSRQAARNAAIGTFTEEQAETFIGNEMRKSAGEPEVTVDVTFISGSYYGNDEVIVDVSVPAAQLTRIQPFGLFRLITLSTKVVMQVEGS